ncbi:MAG: sulfotransferase domain-containing protein [Cyclobacteriaceae bacterium]
MDRPLFCYFGHHKCASTWVISMAYDVCFALGLKLYEKQIVLMDNPSSILEEHSTDFLVSQTSDYEKVKTLNNVRGFHIIRDPRDLIISGYFSHLHSHAIGKWIELKYHRDNLKKVNKDDGLFLEMEFDKYFIDHIATWNYNDPNILELKYEDVSYNPKKYFTLIFEFLEIYGEEIEEKQLWINSYANRVFNRLSLDHRWKLDKMNERFVDHLIAKNHFQKLSNGRSHGEENPKSHYRNGLAGDWKNHFNEQHKKRFKDLFGDLLVRLGYEPNNDW